MQVDTGLSVLFPFISKKIYDRGKTAEKMPNFGSVQSMVEAFIPILLEIPVFFKLATPRSIYHPLRVPIVRQTIKLSDLATFV